MRARYPVPAGVKPRPEPDQPREGSSSRHSAVVDAPNYYIGGAIKRIGGAVQRIGAALGSVHDDSYNGVAPLKGYYGGLPVRPNLLVL